jgi:hypothetical protein
LVRVGAGQLGLDPAEQEQLCGLERSGGEDPLAHQGGFHLLRPVVKLADGTMLVGDHVESYTVDWLETEFALADVRWRSFDPKEAVETRTEAGWKANPNLS